MMKVWIIVSYIILCTKIIWKMKLKSMVYSYEIFCFFMVEFKGIPAKIGKHIKLFILKYIMASVYSRP